MKKLFAKNFTILLALVLSSCSLMNSFKKDQPATIRIVDLHGKSRSVQTKIPELNAQAIISQGRSLQNPNLFVRNTATQGVPVQNQFAQKAANSAPASAVPTNTLQETLQTPQAPQDSNLSPKLSPKNNNFVMADHRKEEVEYDLSSDIQKPQVQKIVVKAPLQKEVVKPVTITQKTTKQKTVKKKSVKKTKSKYSRKKGWFVQVGSFGKSRNAEIALDRMKKFHSGHVEKLSKKKTLYRVLLGPFSSKNSANKLLKKVKKSGHDAVLRRNR